MAEPYHNNQEDVLEQRVSQFYHGNKSVFRDIWKVIESKIKWYKYYDPAGVYTIDDFKQECILFLYKRMHKWNHDIPFLTFAIVKCYTRLNCLISDLVNKSNIHRRGKNRKRAEKYESKYVYIDDNFINILEETEAPDTIYYELYLDSILSSFKGDRLLVLSEMLKCEKNTIQEEIRKIENKHNMTKKQIKNILNEIKPIIMEMLWWNN